MKHDEDFYLTNVRGFKWNKNKRINVKQLVDDENNEYIHYTDALERHRNRSYNNRSPSADERVRRNLERLQDDSRSFFPTKSRIDNGKTERKKAPITALIAGIALLFAAGGTAAAVGIATSDNNDNNNNVVNNGTIITTTTVAPTRVILTVHSLHNISVPVTTCNTIADQLNAELMTYFNRTDFEESTSIIQTSVFACRNLGSTTINNTELPTGFVSRIPGSNILETSTAASTILTVTTTVTPALNTTTVKVNTTTTTTLLLIVNTTVTTTSLPVVNKTTVNTTTSAEVRERVRRQEEESDEEQPAETESETHAESAEGESKEEESAEEESKEGESKKEESAEGESKEEESAEGESSEGESAEGESAEGESAEGESKEEESAEGESAEGESAEGESAEGESAEGESKGEESVEGETKEEEPTAGEPTEGESEIENETKAEKPENEEETKPEVESETPNETNAENSEESENVGNEHLRIPIENAIANAGEIANNSLLHFSIDFLQNTLAVDSMVREDVNNYLQERFPSDFVEKLKDINETQFPKLIEVYVNLVSSANFTTSLSTAVVTTTSTPTSVANVTASANLRQAFINTHQLSVSQTECNANKEAVLNSIITTLQKSNVAENYVSSVFQNCQSLAVGTKRKRQISSSSLFVVQDVFRINNLPSNLLSTPLTTFKTIFNEVDLSYYSILFNSSKAAQFVASTETTATPSPDSKVFKSFHSTTLDEVACNNLTSKLKDEVVNYINITQLKSTFIQTSEDVGCSDNIMSLTMTHRTNSSTIEQIERSYLTSFPQQNTGHSFNQTTYPNLYKYYTQILNVTTI
ncbi:hypothetical protein SNEBB_005832 [Seison nebaliae]|nr:hypothetical protein SNEBB_005832 [Seison nebaliae]